MKNGATVSTFDEPIRMYMWLERAWEGKAGAVVYTQLCRSQRFRAFRAFRLPNLNHVLWPYFNNNCSIKAYNQLS